MHTPVLLRVLSIHGLVYVSTLIPLSLAPCVHIYIYICIYIYIYISPVAAIAIPAALQVKLRVK